MMMNPGIFENESNAVTRLFQRMSIFECVVVHELRYLIMRDDYFNISRFGYIRRRISNPSVPNNSEDLR